jgi:hypothetical protein
MQRWIGKRIVALLDSLFGLAVFAATAALVPLSFPLRMIVLGAVLCLCWFGVEGRRSLPSGTSIDRFRKAISQLVFRLKLSTMLNWPLSTQTPSHAGAEIGLLDRTEIDPREIEYEPRKSIPPPPPPPPPPPNSRKVISPIVYMDLGRFAVSDYQGTGRNDACWCGSGKKYKKCHGS